MNQELDLHCASSYHKLTSRTISSMFQQMAIKPRTKSNSNSSLQLNKFLVQVSSTMLKVENKSHLITLGRRIWFNKSNQAIFLNRSTLQVNSSNLSTKRTWRSRASLVQSTRAFWIKFMILPFFLNIKANQLEAFEKLQWYSIQPQKTYSKHYL